MSDNGDKLNVYEKLQKVRVELQGKNLKKSGKNKHANYGYYELGDFLPMINKLFLENKLFSQISFTAETATLIIVDTEKPESCIEFTSPMAEAKLPACHPIQNIGAVQTYQRRYLYMTALEIVEHDALDATAGEEEETPEKETSITKEQKDSIDKLLVDSELTTAQLNAALKKNFKKDSIDKLTETEAKRTIKDLKKYIQNKKQKEGA